MDADYTDPGWRVPISGLIKDFVFFGWIWLRRDRIRSLSDMRSATIASVLHLLTFASVFGSVARDMDPSDASLGLHLAYLILAGAGTYSLLALLLLDRIFTNKVKEFSAVLPLVRNLFDVDLGIAIAPALFGIVGVFLTASASTCVLGVGLSALALALIAPTRSRISRLEGRLSTNLGRQVGLGRLLTEPATENEGTD